MLDRVHDRSFEAGRHSEIRAEIHVLFDQGPLGVGQLCGLAKHLFRDGKVAHVVQQCRDSESVRVLCRKLQLVRDVARVFLDSSRVPDREG